LGKQGNTAFKYINNLETSGRFIRFILFILVLFSFPFIAFSQRKSDIGIFGGTSYYMGDLNPSKHFYSPGYAFGPIYRYNFDPRSSIRFSGIYHKLSGNSAGYGDLYVESLNSSFDATFIDASANYEINFIPYKTANRKLKQSLYLTAGAGYHVLLTTNAKEGMSHFMIPFGIGYKFNTTKKMSAGVELSVRKTFTDTGIDGITNIDSETNNTLFGNKDWYTFAGIFISYKIFNYRDDCPAYD
jgi:hypothetical protein